MSNRFDVVNKIHSMVEKFDSGHSAVQIKYFVLGVLDNPTPWSRYVQCMRELEVRAGVIENGEIAVRELKNKIGLLERNMKLASDEFALVSMQCEADRAAVALRDATRQLDRHYREVGVLLEEASKCAPPEDADHYAEELEAWRVRTMLNPVAFEEKYGAAYVRHMLGEERFSKYVESKQAMRIAVASELLGVTTCVPE